MPLSNQLNCYALDYSLHGYQEHVGYPTMPIIHSIQQNAIQNYGPMFVMPFLMHPKMPYAIQF